MADLDSLLRAQRDYFDTGATRDLDFRSRQLDILRQTIEKHEKRLFEALRADVGKPEFESYISEVGFVYADIRHTKKHFRKWARPRKVHTPLLGFPARSEIHVEPLGQVLVIGPWNYPFMLLLSPLVGAIAAGDCTVLKPSELAPETARVVGELVASAFDPRYVAVIPGGVPETTALLERRFDHIFFTGSTMVGRIVMQAAARHLTPVTLELGGKSPCIVDRLDRDADLEVTARRIAWGKFFNAGQTCIAPDYLYVHRDVKPRLLDLIGGQIDKFYSSNPAASSDYARVVNARHFERLKKLLGSGSIAIGGRVDAAKRYISPTVLDGVKPSDPVMQEEIFGPILPVMEYSDLGEVIRYVRGQPKPLALYFFSSDAGNQKRVLDELSFGGGCINDCLMHLTTPGLPFGGVGDSGMGAYHGQLSFEVFSHRKGIIRNRFWPDLPVRYPPYGSRALSLVKRLL